MSTTVTSYSVGLTMDANKYIKNSMLSRAETAKLTRQINSARSPVEEYARTYDLLETAFTKQAISLETYQRLLAQAQEKRDRLTKTEQAAVPALEKTTTLTQDLTGKLKTLAAGYLSLAAAQRVMSSVRQEFLDVDEIAKSSRAIGENFNQMQRYRFAVAEFTGIDGPAATTMLTKLTQRVGEASLGIGEAGENFRKLGIDVQAMAAASPVEQFEMLSEAIRKIENPTEQVAMATKFFEEQGAKLLPLLRATKDEYEASAGQIDRLGLAMSDLDVANVEATNDAIGRLEAALGGLSRQVASMPNLAKGIDMLAASATTLDQAFANIPNFGIGQVQGFANDAAVNAYAEKTKDVREHLEEIDRLQKRMLQQRAAAEAAANQPQEQKEVTEAAEKQLEVVEKISEVERERQRAAEEAAKQQADMARNALAAAKKHFDEEIKRQQKMQQDMVSKFSSVEVGSAEDIKLQAEAINRSIMPAADAVNPTEDQILEEAKKQYNALVEANQKSDQQQETMVKMLDELKNNGFKRFR